MAHPSLERLGPPPRQVPLLVRCHIMFGGFAQAGWFFFGFGMIFFWGFALNCEFASWFTFRGETRTAPGVVTRSEHAGFSEGGGKHRKGTPVYANHYTFTAPGGRECSGCSYALGRQLPPGASVTVEYLAGDPAASRIEGMRIKPLGGWAVLVVLFPLIGLGLALPGVLTSLKAARLIERGYLADGTLRSREPTNTRINKRTVYKLFFDFTARNGQKYEAVAKTHLVENLEDEATEKLIYDPERPGDAILLDALPGSFRVGELGKLEADKPVQALLVTIVPAVSILGHGAYAILRFLS
jgi:hypothetical protein